MAASGKAQALKDAYVEAIAREAGPEVMAAASQGINADLAGKLGMKVAGDQASVKFHLDGKKGRTTYIDDGDPNMYASRDGVEYKYNQEGADFNSVLSKPVATPAGPGMLSMRDLTKQERNDVNYLIDYGREDTGGFVAKDGIKRSPKTARHPELEAMQQRIDSGAPTPGVTAEESRRIRQDLDNVDYSKYNDSPAPQRQSTPAPQRQSTPAPQRQSTPAPQSTGISGAARLFQESMQRDNSYAATPEPRRQQRSGSSFRERLGRGLRQFGADMNRQTQENIRRQQSTPRSYTLKASPYFQNTYDMTPNMY